jgi:hypothetical protein
VFAREVFAIPQVARALDTLLNRSLRWCALLLPSHSNPSGVGEIPQDLIGHHK